MKKVEKRSYDWEKQYKGNDSNRETVKGGVLYINMLYAVAFIINVLGCNTMFSHKFPLYFPSYI